MASRIRRRQRSTDEAEGERAQPTRRFSARACSPRRARTTRSSPSPPRCLREPGVDLFAEEFPEARLRRRHRRAARGDLRGWPRAPRAIKPFCAIYSTFLQRAYDQIVHDVAIQNLPVRFAIDRAGLVGADGPTHAGSFDIAYLGCLPNMVIMAAADEAELVHMVATAADYNEARSRSAIRAARASASSMPERGEPLAIGRGRILREGSRDRPAVPRHASGGVPQGRRRAGQPRAFDHGRGRPLRKAARHGDLIERLAREHEVLITVEEGSIGGFGAYVLQSSGGGRSARRGSARPRDDPARPLPRAGQAGAALCCGGLDAARLSRRRSRSLPRLSGRTVYAPGVLASKLPWRNPFGGDFPCA